MHILMALLAGLLFGIGLLLSGMTNPAKVQGFLDLAGRWDPSLVFVMLGAIMVGLVAFRLAHARTANLLGGAMHLPRARHIDKRLVGGAAVFGVGWGLAGFCPGPALVMAGAGAGKAVLFVLAMIGGMVLFEIFERVGARAAATSEGM